MTDLSKSEAKSFFNANAIPLPSNKNALVDIYLDPVTLELSIVPLSGNPQSLGFVTPDLPLSIADVVLDAGELSLVMSDNSIIEIDSISRPDVYVVPELEGTGLKRADGTFTPLRTTQPGVSIVETEDAITVSAAGLTSAKAVKRAEVAKRITAPSAANTSVADNTGMVANAWCFTAMTFIDDSDEIGITIVDGRIHIPPGTYYWDGWFAFHRCNTHSMRLWSVTHNNVVALTQTGHSGNSSEHSVLVPVGTGYFTLLEPTIIEVQLRPAIIGSTLWTVYGSTWGMESDYIRMEFWKIPESQGSVPPIKYRSEVTKRVASDADSELVITGSSQYSALYPPWRASDSDGLAAANCWITLAAPTPAAPQWIIYRFTAGPKRITQYGVWNTSVTAQSIYGPKSWELQGRNSDADEWVVLDSVVGNLLTVAGGAIVRDLPAPVEYSQYRLWVTERNGTAAYMYLGEFRLFEEY